MIMFSQLSSAAPCVQLKDPVMSTRLSSTANCRTTDARGGVDACGGGRVVWFCVTANRATSSQHRSKSRHTAGSKGSGEKHAVLGCRTKRHCTTTPQRHHLVLFSFLFLFLLLFWFLFLFFILLVSSGLYLVVHVSWRVVHANLDACVLQVRNVAALSTGALVVRHNAHLLKKRWRVE